MPSEQEYLRKCDEAFPGIRSKSELSFQELNDFMRDDSSGGKVASKAQQALLRDLALSKTFIGTTIENRLLLDPPVNASKLAVAASQCIGAAMRDRQRTENDEYATKEILPTVDRKLAEAILQKGPEAWAPILKLQGRSGESGGGATLPQIHPPTLSPKEEAVQKVLKTLPHVEVVLTPDVNVRKDGRPTFDISVKLKQRN